MTREDVIAWAERLGLPPIVRELIRGEPLSGELASLFGFPEEFILMSETERAAHGWSGLVPLWDNGNFDEVVAYSPGQRGYVRFYVEAPLDPTTVAPGNWQQVVFPDFIRLYEAEVPDDLFRDYARLFDFRHAEDVIAGFATQDLSTFEKFEAWKAGLLKRLGEAGRPTRG